MGTLEYNLIRCTVINAIVYVLTYAEVAQLDAGRWFSSRFAATRIPTLEQVLQLCRGRIGLNVEIKHSADNPALEAETVRLLREYGIAVRDCSNYRGMEDGSWFRAAVRLEEDHQRLADALRGILHPSVPVPPRPRSRRPALMLQGTSSDAGKSILAAAFCRILRQDGYVVAPF